MSNPEYLVGYAVDSMQSACTAIQKLSDELPVDKPLGAYEVHQLHVALESVAENLLRETLECKSGLDSLKKEIEEDVEPPSYVSLPSLPSWAEEGVEERGKEHKSDCDCEDYVPDCSSSSSTDYGGHHLTREESDRERNYLDSDYSSDF